MQYSFESTEDLQKWLKISMLVFLVLTAAMLVWEFSFAFIMHGTPISRFTGNILLGIFPVFRWINILAFIVLFSLWVSRAHTNNWAMGLQGLSYRPDQAVIWMFIPLMNLYKPILVLQEMFMASDPDTDIPGKTLKWQNGDAPGTIGIWWVMVMLFMSIGNPGTWWWLFEGFSEDNYIGYHFMHIVFLCLEIVLMYMAWNLTKDHWERQKTKYARLQAAAA